MRSCWRARSCRVGGTWSSAHLHGDGLFVSFGTWSARPAVALCRLGCERRIEAEHVKELFAGITSDRFSTKGQMKVRISE